MNNRVFYKKHLTEGSLLDGIAPGADGKIDVVTVFAHPDDEVLYCGGSLIKVNQEEHVRLHIVCITKGNKDESKDRIGINEDCLAEIRKRELGNVAGILGAESVVIMNYDDQSLPYADKNLLRRKIKDAVTSCGADVVITHDPFGLSGHVDHIITSEITSSLFSDTSARALYYVTLPKLRYGFYSLFALSKSDAEKAGPTLKVNIKKQKRLKKLALYTHVTQHHFSPSNGFSMAEDLLHDWEYFTLKFVN